MPSLTVNGYEFEFPARYMAGHECTVGDAAQLEKDRKNVFYVRVSKNLKKGMSPEDAQAELDAYAVKYQFGQRMGGGPRTKDPVTVKAIEIATRHVRDRIKQAGGKLKDIKQGLINRRAREWVSDPARGYMDLAKKELRKAAPQHTIDEDIADLLGL